MKVNNSTDGDFEHTITLEEYRRQQERAGDRQIVSSRRESRNSFVASSQEIK